MNTRAESLARALGGHREGSGWKARCPAHEDGTPSLSIAQADGRVLVHCFAGCGQERVLAVLRERRGGAPPPPPPPLPPPPPPRPAPPPPAPPRPAQAAAARSPPRRARSR